MYDGDGKDGSAGDDADHDTHALGHSHTVEHARRPKRHDEAPIAPDPVDEDANAARLVGGTVDGICDEDGGDDLVARRRNGDSDLQSRQV